jgi:hypothetical protein
VIDFASVERSRKEPHLGDFSWVERYKAYYARKQA